jgi:nucleoside-diphosphate-sugar epimerase
MTGPVAVTGATGFVGRALVERLIEDGRQVWAATRRRPDAAGRAAWRRIGDLGPDTDWGPVLDGADVVVHLAGRAHVMRETETDPSLAYHRINVEGSLNLARRAAEAGVRRLVFVSTVKVHGDQAPPNDPLTSAHPLRPKDPYGQSKALAEKYLWELSESSGLEMVVVRPPLVYGPGVKGNFRRLIDLADRAMPLPLAWVNNRRSMIGLGNLVAFLSRTIDHPRAGGRAFLVKDPVDPSTPELLADLARHLDRPARLWPCPVGLLKAAGRLVGRGAQVERLFGSLVVDDAETRRVLGWTPPHDRDEELAATIRWYRARSA